jgi:hypothetical protein
MSAEGGGLRGAPRSAPVRLLAAFVRAMQEDRMEDAMGLVKQSKSVAAAGSVPWC